MIFNEWQKKKQTRRQEPALTVLVVFLKCTNVGVEPSSVISQVGQGFCAITGLWDGFKYQTWYPWGTWQTHWVNQAKPYTAQALMKPLAILLSQFLRAGIASVRHRFRLGKLPSISKFNLNNTMIMVKEPVHYLNFSLPRRNHEVILASEKTFLVPNSSPLCHLVHHTNGPGRSWSHSTPCQR